MLLKAIASIVLTPIMFVGQFFGISKPTVYKAQPYPAQTTRPAVIKPEPKATSTSKTVKSKVATSTREKPKVKPVATTPKVKTVEKATSVSPSIPNPPQPLADFAIINTNSRKTIVNILCTTKFGDLSPISGTGVIISGNGLILTNAHIAQYLLIKDFREKDYLKCVARTGSPAYPKYNLELVYISPTWVKDNKTQLKQTDPKGTGENDYAFLRIVDMVDKSQTLEPLTYIQPNTNESINIGEPVLLVAYPAGFLGGQSILNDLNITSSVTTIQDVFTFKSNTIDIISVGGTIVSQKGSSGGLVVDKNTALIGIITTSTDASTTKTRELNAITLPYINRAMKQELGIDLSQFIKSDHAEFARNFLNSDLPTLSKLITDELLRQ